VPHAGLALPVDVTDAAALKAAAGETQAQAGPIRALVINAGILGPVARAWEIDPAEVRRVIDIDLVAAFLTVQAVVPLMLANPGPDRGASSWCRRCRARKGPRCPVRTPRPRPA
jgi:3-oxoacyl-[acyl-carrier protein] reductase